MKTGDAAQLEVEPKRQRSGSGHDGIVPIQDLYFTRSTTMSQSDGLANCYYTPRATHR